MKAIIVAGGHGVGTFRSSLHRMTHTKRLRAKHL